MKRKVFVIPAIVLSLLLLLAACGGSNEEEGIVLGGYKIGKKPKREEVTGFLITHGGMSADSAWSYAVHRSPGGDVTLTHNFWDAGKAEQAEEILPVPEEAWQDLLSLLDGEKLVKDKKPLFDVMDGESQTFRVFWDGGSSNYHLEPETAKYQEILKKLVQICTAHRMDLSDLSELESFSFYTTGTYVSAGVNCDIIDEVDKNEEPTGQKRILYKADGVSYEEAPSVPLTAAFLEKLGALLEEYEIASWNGFSESDPNVLDGTSFSLYISFRDREKNISAHGYMAFPPNYHAFRDALKALFEAAVTQ